MKRILVIDDSEVVRETVALVLGREFVVSKRPLGVKGLPLSDIQEQFDLLILGIAPQHGMEAASLVRFASQMPFTVLFLVDSRSTARVIEDEAQAGCLTKPFNPYELHEKVGQLLARRLTRPSPDLGAAGSVAGVLEYLDFPYLSRSAAILARRFAAAPLPLLICGEIGCGQSRIAAAIHGLQSAGGRRVVVNAAMESGDYLAQKRLELSVSQGPGGPPATLVIEGLDKCGPLAQSSLTRFLDEAEEKFSHLRWLTTATADLLERVYRGEFPEALYFRLATLTLKLKPLRERCEDLPALAEWFARRCARDLGIAEPSLSPEAQRRLTNYLWFGNLSELESVIARTLVLHRKPRVEAADLVFDFGKDVPVTDLDEWTAQIQKRAEPVEPRFQAYGAPPSPNGSTHGHVKVELNAVIHELAHELKNPMVTIKTFAQLLGDRYQDENFRSRFQEVVGNDIERMDDLLEIMIEFADFREPRKIDVELREKLAGVLNDIHDESAKRQVRLDWKSGVSEPVSADESQVSYILKNVMLATLLEARAGSAIEIDTARRGAVEIVYLREGPRTASITHYLGGPSQPGGALLPLRILLAKQLVERNGGRLVIDQASEEREIIRIEFPVNDG
jgi:DNA-binding NtrC family response regulator